MSWRPRRHCRRKARYTLSRLQSAEHAIRAGRYVALIRAINVAGHAIVKMDDLKQTFARAGCTEIRTLIQSGNVIFDAQHEDAETVFRTIRLRLGELLGSEPTVVFRTLRELERIVRRAPFKDFENDSEAKLYVAFLSRKPSSTPKLPLLSAKEALEAIAMKNLEVFIVSRRKKNG